MSFYQKITVTAASSTAYTEIIPDDQGQFSVTNLGPETVYLMAGQADAPFPSFSSDTWYQLNVGATVTSSQSVNHPLMGNTSGGTSFVNVAAPGAS